MNPPPVTACTIRSLALLMLTFGQACDDHNPPATPTSAWDAESHEAAPVPVDELGEPPYMLDLAREIHGFAGIYLEPGTDRIVIAMSETEAAAFSSARQAVLARLARPTGSPPMPEGRALQFVERAVEYSFIDLARHRARLRPRIFAIPGVGSLEVDEEFNRIKIGLLDSSARKAVEQLTNDLAVPAGMISFSATSAVDELYLPVNEASMSQHPDSGTLRARTERLTAGYRVQAVPERYCTLGFTAVPERSRVELFVSASHCSQTRWSTDGGIWFQPAFNLATHDDYSVGDEMLDPEPHDCLRNEWVQRCRHSEATVVAVDTTPPYRIPPIALGQIARTTERVDCNDCSASVQIHEYDKSMTITDVRVDRGGMVGEILDKVGHQTGWTYGRVSSTCVDYTTVDEFETVVYILCNDLVRTAADNGDSGAPVFKYYEDNTAELVGMLWGKIANVNLAIVSPYVQIQKDFAELLAPLRIVDPGLWASVHGPTLVGPDVECTWTATYGDLDPFATVHWIEGLVGIGDMITGTISESGPLVAWTRDAIGRGIWGGLMITVSDTVTECSTGGPGLP